VVLMDFGAGRELDATDKQIAGTPLYLAPEVLSGGVATRRSDAYGVGVVLFRLLTHTYPVSGIDQAELRRAHVAGGAPSARVDRAEIPQRLRRVLARALDPDAVQRYPDSVALVAALLATERAPLRRRVTIAVAAAAAILIAGGTGWNLGLREWLSPGLEALGVFAKTPTIAVLPFRDAGSDPGHGGFIDGLTSEVIRDLGTIEGLLVTAEASAFFFKNRPRDLPDIAKKLHADFVVEATVQRVGDRLRLHAQLARVSDDVVLWFEPYDRPINDVMAIQADIARQIVNKLRLTLGGGITATIHPLAREPMSFALGMPLMY
jgi:TolB-like protein